MFLCVLLLARANRNVQFVKSIHRLAKKLSFFFFLHNEREIEFVIN